VGDLDPLAQAQEEDGVVSHHVAAAQGLDADLLAGARADVAVAGVAGGLGQVAAAPSAAASARRRAVPEGASRFMRWWVSTTSMS
jgi:hypothetical protein